MSLSIEEVRHIAELARLKLTDEELETYRVQLSSILDHVDSLQDLDTSGIPPTSSVLPPQTVLRQDEPRPGLTLDQVLKNAPDAEKGQFRVPPVLD
ncbi:MAG: Asp-tRNA(Asn)/Glu-tRNA(Gln) amidotransferase subunit GatC [Anaerolineales bacterium]|nr:Asp-tRNA(Asn)/Glu-tRNA(Gln) amidotransferase subunit GatC [Anaerolineales bacterium]